eukprot:CAMPEP_0185768174 /NCGR_PEP_ID=MMETSP1174-20130828/48038_1 /TAXON_ID=35687 /ORGANISM="Dictyocha speculum, Strain CCMP1381" /LENGTH=382 /DNA_ID=CAMNT_0028452753 /DNA_START=57 /DNA_END=1205 /DNA_ORIENTATION=+
MASLLQGFGGGAFGNPAEPIVKMKVGKMEAANIPDKPGKFMITPVPAKGQLQLMKDEQNPGILMFQWKDRVLNSMDLNLTLFPGDARLIKVNTGKEGDRVYMLQFTSDRNKRFFFWCQDKDDSKDVELVTKINETMNNPQSAQADSASGNSQQAEMLQMLNLAGAGPTTETTEASGSTESAAPVAAAPSSTASRQQGQLSSEYLQSMLQNLGNAPGSATSTSSTSAANTSNATASNAATGQGGSLTTADIAAAMRLAQGMAPRAAPVPLQEIATSDEIMRTGILEDEAIQQRLIALLPEGLQTPGELHASIHSPQFQQTLTALTSALGSEQYNSIFANFGLDASAGAEALNRGDVIEAFIAALEAQRDEDTGNSSTDGKTPE